MTTQEIIEVIKGLSVLELNDLVKACEEEFGVSAAAGVVVAAGAAGAAEEAEEKTEFDVELTEVGGQKVKVIKLFVRSQVLVLKKQKLLLTALLRTSKKLFPKKKQKTSKNRWKKLEQKLQSNNWAFPIRNHNHGYKTPVFLVGEQAFFCCTF